jgi:hypothetical protein
MSPTQKQLSVWAANLEKARAAKQQRAVANAATLAGQLEQLLHVAAEHEYHQAVPILRMHLRAARLDCSLDAVRRGVL